MVIFAQDLYDFDDPAKAKELSADNPKVLQTWVSGRKVYDSKAV